jgi:methylenetetrahydrofolate--tRNA-(uracil-5-)-methyltransferase
MGLLAGLFTAFLLEGKTLPPPPPSTTLGALLRYITSPETEKDFQPMNINFGILPPLTGKKIRKKEKHALLVRRALEDLDDWLRNHFKK